MGFSWVSVDALTGNVRADLPLLDGVDGDMSIAQTIGRYETAQATLPIASLFAVPEWVRATLPGGSHLILLDDNPNDPTHGIPSWGGLITQRLRDESDRITLSLVTPEGYLDRRYVGTQTFTAIGQNEIIQGLITGYIQVGVNGGVPMRVQLLAGSDPVLTQAYLDQDDKTVYSIMTDLMSLTGGPEWYCGWEWQTNPERITPVLYVGARIGTSAPAGLVPNSTFDMPGPVTGFQYFEDYSTGKGANSAIATGVAAGTVRPQSLAQVVTDPNRPTFEYRFAPTVATQDVPTLTNLAMAAVTSLAGGTDTLALTADLYTAPRLNIDWSMGDDLGFNLGGPDANGNDLVPAFPGGFSGVARSIGYQRMLGATPTITPVLAAPPSF